MPAHFLHAILAALLALIFAFPQHALAEVRLPNGEWVDRNEDLRVKVLGGFVTVERTWLAERQNRNEWRWHINPAWANLSFRYEQRGAASVLVAIGRAGATFDRTGDDSPVFVFDKHFFIREREGGVPGWRWYDRKGNWIHYDADGVIQEYGDRNDIRVSFNHDGEGRLSQVRDHHGAIVLTVAYTANTTTITDRANRQVVYEYEGGALTGVLDVMGERWSYEYAGTGNQRLMTVKRDPEGRETRIRYAGYRVAEVEVGVLDQEPGQVTQYVYDYNRVRRQHTIRECAPSCAVPERRETARRYDFAGTLLEHTVGNRSTLRLLRDGAHVEIRINERGLRTTTEFDAHRNPRRIRHPDGTEVSMEYEPIFGLLTRRVDESGVVTRYAYDGRGNLLSQIEADGRPDARTTEYTYDPLLGQRLTRTVRGTIPAEDATTTWTYDIHGNVASEIDAEQNTTLYPKYHVSGQPEHRRDPRQKLWQYGYDPAGRLTAASNPLGQEVRYVYDKVGNRIRVIDPMEQHTVFTYTPTNWLASEQRPGQGSPTVYTYHPNPYGELHTQTDPDGVTSIYAYDTSGRLASVTDGAGNVTVHQYGTALSGMAGLLLAVHYPTYSEHYRYDSRDRRTRVIRDIPDTSQPGGQRTDTTVTAYDAVGRAINVTDPAGRLTRHDYDDLGRLVLTTDPMGGETAYGYDTRDNLRTVTDARQNTHLFIYDRANRLRREQRPGGQGIDYDYHPDGTLAMRTNALGQRREYVYDDAGRRLEERHFDVGASEAAQTILYSHDPRGLLESYVQSGDTDSAGTFIYNLRGEKTAESVTFGQGAGAFTRSLAYDPGEAGRPARFVYPDGKVVDYRYDEAGRLIAIDAPGGSITYHDYQWLQPTRVELPGAVRTLAYDVLQRPLVIRAQALGGGTPQAPQGEVLMDYRYTYDAAGNITERDTEAGPYQYGYDALDRLTQAVPPPAHQSSATQPDMLPVEGYGYDPVHNRIHSAHQPGSWQYNENNELLAYGLGEEAVQFVYDANGHTIQETRGTGEVLTYHYNVAERLSEIRRNGSVIASYHYDPMGRRIRKQVGGGVTWFQYSDAGLVAEYDASGWLERVYGWRPEGLWGTDAAFLADVTESTNATHWMVHHFHSDHLGVSVKLSDSEGQVNWETLMEAFGRSILKSRSTVNNPMRLPGQYEDSEVSLYYNYFRSYSYERGIYISADPIGIHGGINSVLYADANPLLGMDPYGLFCIPLMSDKSGWRVTSRKQRDVVDVRLDSGYGFVRCTWRRAWDVIRERDVWDRWYCRECFEETYKCSGSNYWKCNWFLKRSSLPRVESDHDIEFQIEVTWGVGTGATSSSCYLCRDPYTGAQPLLCPDRN